MSQNCGLGLRPKGARPRTVMATSAVPRSNHCQIARWMSRCVRTPVLGRGGQKRDGYHERTGSVISRRARRYRRWSVMATVIVEAPRSAKRGVRAAVISALTLACLAGSLLAVDMLRGHNPLVATSFELRECRCTRDRRGRVDQLRRRGRGARNGDQRSQRSAGHRRARCARPGRKRARSMFRSPR